MVDSYFYDTSAKGGLGLKNNHVFSNCYDINTNTSASSIFSLNLAQNDLGNIAHEDVGNNLRPSEQSIEANFQKVKIL